MPVLIQAADIFGVWGLTFILALINGYFVDILRLPLSKIRFVDANLGYPAQTKSRWRISPAIGRLTAAVSVLTIAYLAYGVFRLGENVTRPGPRVAVIQENVPQSLKDAPDSRDEVFVDHLELARHAATSDPKPDLVAWPETMVTSPINEDLIEQTPDNFKTADELRVALKRAEEAKDAYRRVDDVYKALSDVVVQTGVPELVGYGAYIPETGSRPAVMQNRTLLLVPGALGALRAGEYSKRHLVPFGEYIPFRGVPVLSGMMLWFSPVDYDYSNTPGNAWTRFRMTVSSRSTDAAATQITSSTRFYEFGTPICFEDMMPEPAREMARANGAGGGRKADFLVNVSNDGWFLSVELDQHLQACQMRAVENRVPIARSVNTGNSGFIDSCGRIVKLVRDANGNSIGAVGTESWVMEIDGRETFFSRIGDLFPIICGIIATLLVGWTLVRPRRAGMVGTSASAESA
jgi:apolipoprotein N-acyltransferase